jgi:hypothetical protein
MSLSSFTVTFSRACVRARARACVYRLWWLVLRVPSNWSRDPGFNSQRYQIFWAVVGLERGPLSFVRIIEELFERKNSGSGVENRN